MKTNRERGGVTKTRWLKAVYQVSYFISLCFCCKWGTYSQVSLKFIIELTFSSLKCETKGGKKAGFPY